MIRAPLLIVFTVVLGGCAGLRGASGPTPDAELARGLAALRAQDYAGARAILEPLHNAEGTKAVGQRALLALAAAELDPRNPNRRLRMGSQLAGQLLGTPNLSPWEVPAAETLYLLAVELGANEEELARAENTAQEQAQAARQLRSEVTSVPARIAKVTKERDALQGRVDQLQQTLRTRDRDLAEAKQELERIKKTLKIQ